MRSAFPHAIFTFVLIATSFVNAADEKSEPPGLGEPGKLQSIAIETGRAKDGAIVLSGRGSAQQLLVEGKYDSGHKRCRNQYEREDSVRESVCTVESCL